MTRALAVLVLLLAPLLASAQDQAAPVPTPPAAQTQPSPAPAPAEPQPWQSYPAREVDRPILPAADGYLMSISLSSSSAVDRFNDSGVQEKLEKPISIFNLDINVHYGIVDRWEIFAGLPYATAQTSEFSSGAIGNVYLGTRAALVATDRFQLAAGLQVSAPTGESQFHYHLTNGKIVPENFRTGNPGVDFFPEVQARFKSGSNLSVRLRAQAIFTGTGQTVLNQIGGEDVKKNVNPGDGWAADAALYYQASNRWVVPVGLEYYQLSATEVPGFNFNDRQERLGLRAGVMFQVSPAFEVVLDAGLPLTGRNVYLAAPIGLELRSRF